jgi:hypothetical protein
MSEHDQDDKEKKERKEKEPRDLDPKKDPHGGGKPGTGGTGPPILPPTGNT